MVAQIQSAEERRERKHNRRSHLFILLVLARSGQASPGSESDLRRCDDVGQIRPETEQQQGDNINNILLLLLLSTDVNPVKN